MTRASKWLTHWGRAKMAAGFQTAFSNAFSEKKMYEFRLKFHWKLFLRVQLILFQYQFRWWLGADQATSHYLNRWWSGYWRINVSLGLNELIGHWTYFCCHPYDISIKRWHNDYNHIYIYIIDAAMIISIYKKIIWTPVVKQQLYMPHTCCITINYVCHD